MDNAGFISGGTSTEPQLTEEDTSISSYEYSRELREKLFLAEVQLKEAETNQAQVTQEFKAAQAKAAAELESQRTIGGGGSTIVTVPPNLTPSNGGGRNTGNGGCP
jgi:hypothetical protein